MTEEEKKIRHRESVYKWKRLHRDQVNEIARRWQANHREEQQKRMNDYHETKQGRATNLLTSYRQFDMRRFGLYPDLTQEDIIRICFSEGSKCIWCGNDNWRELGLDRLTNEKPHSVGNVMCCCSKCNTQRHRRTLGEYLELIGKTPDEWFEQNDATIGDGYITIKYPEK